MGSMGGVQKHRFEVWGSVSGYIGASAVSQAHTHELDAVAGWWAIWISWDSDILTTQYSNSLPRTHARDRREQHV